MPLVSATTTRFGVVPLLASTPFYVETRDGGSPSLVLVHGFGAHGAFWRKWVAGLAPQHRCHVIDLPGFGRSPPSADPSPEGQAKLLANYLEGLGEDRIVLVGHSLGGGIALLAALELAKRGTLDRLAGLVLVSAAVYRQRFPPYLSLARILGIGEIFLLITPPVWAIRRGLRGIVCDPASIDEEQVAIQRSPYLSRERRRSLLRSARAIDAHNGDLISEKLSGMHVPTLLLWGEEDPVVPVENGRRLAHELPSARLVIMGGVGHLPPLESPAASLASVVHFLRELSDWGSGS